MFNEMTTKSRVIECIRDKNYFFWLPMMALLAGCLADPVKLSDSAMPKLRTILVVAVESPPLEVIPDLLETRQPVYRHYNNMVLPLFPDVSVYRNPGGILIAGHIGQEDSVEEVNLSRVEDASDKFDRLQSMTSTSGDWMPTHELSIEAASQLCANQIEAIPGKHMLSLPLAIKERGADLIIWRDAVNQWYGRNTTMINYRNQEADAIDAVLEVGIGQYKIFAGQVSLQVLIKLIDVRTGRVIARSSEMTRSYEASTQTLLDHQGTKFKALIRAMGERLMAQGFQEIGLIPKRPSVIRS